MPEKGEKTIIPRRKQNETEAEFQKRTDAANEIANPTPPDDMPIIKTDVKPVSIAGKTVAISVTDKARLLDTKKNKIITGFIPFALALQQTKDHSHIQIINEEEYRRNNPGK